MSSNNGKFNYPEVNTQLQDDWKSLKPTYQDQKSFISGGKLHSTSIQNTQENKKLKTSTSQSVNELRPNEIKNESNETEELPILTSTNPLLKIIEESSSSKSSPSGGPNLSFYYKGSNRLLTLYISQLEKGPLIFGRSSEIQLNHPSCSRAHAKIVCRKSSESESKYEFFLIDLKSSNGTFLNGGKQPPDSESQLDNGDEISFGLSEQTIYFHDPKNGIYKLPSATENYSKHSRIPLAPKRKIDELVGNNPLKTPSTTTSVNSSSFTSSKNMGVPSRVRCKHILKKHIGSRNPFDSYRKLKITRTKQEAITEIHSFLDKLKGNSLKFDTLAKQYSECSSAARSGDLGFFTKGQMQKAFEDVAFSLNIGEISDAVDTPSGIHIILREE